MAEKTFLSGARTIEELEARDAEKNKATEPAKEEVKTEPVIDEVKKEEPPKEEVNKEEPVKVDWLGEINKNFKTEYKSPEEFGQVFEKTKKVNEYETKLKGYEDSEVKYKKQLEELQGSLKTIKNPLNYFSTPEHYVAEQLIMQRPDLNPHVLQEVITKDNKVMSDIEVLVKNALLTTPGLKGGEQGVKDTILSDLNIDSTLPEEEWPFTVQNRIMMKANQARKEWDGLKSTVVIPKVSSPEEEVAETERLRVEKQTKLTPLKDTFSKFNKYTEEIEPGKILDLIVPDEYKEVLPKMFDTYFIEAGLEPTAENLATMEELKVALYLKKNIKQIYKVIEGDVETRMKAERDVLLGNKTPANTKTATEVEASESQKFSKEFGLGKLFSKK